MSAEIQPRFRDFGHCEFCNKCFEDDYFVCVLFDNEKSGAENEKRVFEMCKNCHKKCRTDKAFEKYVTEKAFSMKLGRKLKIKGDRNDK